jgi:excisionase family DNA binding protein
MLAMPVSTNPRTFQGFKARPGILPAGVPASGADGAAAIRVQPPVAPLLSLEGQAGARGVHPGVRDGIALPEESTRIFDGPDAEVFLPLSRVAEALGVTKRTVYRLIAGQELPQPVKVGAKSLMPKSDLRAYMARKMRERHQ